MSALISMPSSPNCKKQVEVLISQNRKIMDIYKKHMDIREKGTGDYLPVLKDLVDYMSSTFHEENMIMMQNDYPSFSEHARAHQKFTQKVEEFIYAYEMNDNALGFKIFIFLKDWMRDHTSKLDVECALYLRNRTTDITEINSDMSIFSDRLLAFSTIG